MLHIEKLFVTGEHQVFYENVKKKKKKIVKSINLLLVHQMVYFKYQKTNYAKS